MEQEQDMEWKIHMYKEIDGEMTIGMNIAEKKCRKLEMRAIDWTPQLTILWKTILYWKLIIRKLEGHSRVGTNWLQWLHQTLQLPGYNKVNKDQAKEFLRDFKQYKDYKIVCIQKRKTWLEEISEEIANTKGIKVAGFKNSLLIRK